MQDLEARRIVDKANEVGKNLTGDFRQVRELCDSADVVWGIWQGGNMMIVKGEGVLRFIADSGVAEELGWTAIPCASAEHAAALKLVLAGKKR